MDAMAQDPHANRDWTHPGRPNHQTGEWGTLGLETHLHSDDIRHAIDASSFSSIITDVGSLDPEFIETEDNTGQRKWKIKKMIIGDRKYEVTERFLVSLFAKYGFGSSMLRYFSPPEIFERIALRAPKPELRLTTYRDSVLAASNPEKAFIQADDLANVLTNCEAPPLSLTWNGTQFVSVHSVPEHPFEVLGDTFEPRFCLFTPVDGYGRPAAYLTVQRYRCMNALLAYAKMFRSEVQLGHGAGNQAEPLLRFLDSFNNEEGFQGLRQRLTTACETSASVLEVAKFRKALMRALKGINEDTGMISDSYPKIFGALTDLTGDVSELFQVGGDGWIPPSRQKNLNTKTTVMDLMNFSTEVTTHYDKFLESQRPLNEWVGTMASKIPFDLEGIPLADFEESDEGVSVRDERQDYYLLHRMQESVELN